MFDKYFFATIIWNLKRQALLGWLFAQIVLVTYQGGPSAGLADTMEYTKAILLCGGILRLLDFPSVFIPLLFSPLGL